MIRIDEFTQLKNIFALVIKILRMLLNCNKYNISIFISVCRKQCLSITGFQKNSIQFQQTTDIKFSQYVTVKNLLYAICKATQCFVLQLLPVNV